MKLIHTIVIPILASFLANCASPTPAAFGSAGTKAQINKYQSVAVLSFSDATTGGSAETKAAAVATGREFADLLAQEIRATESFRSVTRSKPKGDALLITGRITEADEGSAFWRIAAGSLGVGRAQFSADISFRDNRTGKEFHGFNAFRSSRTPLPVMSDTAWYEDVEWSMKAIARGLAADLAEARKK